MAGPFVSITLQSPQGVPVPALGEVVDQAQEEDNQVLVNVAEAIHRHRDMDNLTSNTSKATDMVRDRTKIPTLDFRSSDSYTSTQIATTCNGSTSS